MFKKPYVLGLLFFIFCGIIQADVPHDSTKFITYWFSWGQNNPVYQIPNLTNMPKGVDFVFVAFGLEKTDRTGITLQADDMNAFAKDVKNLQDRGIKIILSTGGACGPYPWSDAQDDQIIANQYIEFLTRYHLDGLDFDVEAPEKADRIPAIVQLIKQKIPNLLVSLTVGDDGAGMPVYLEKIGKELYSHESLNYVNFMDYDEFYTPSTCSYDDLNLNHNCYIKNIQNLVGQITTWTKDENKAKRLISNGIMIGLADDRKNMTPELTQKLTSWLKENNYGAVMTWGISRDQSTAGGDLANSTGVPNQEPLIYTKSIIGSL